MRRRIMPGRPNNTNVVAACTRRLRALANYAGGASAIAINGRKLTVAEVVAIYEECLGSRADLAQLRAIARAAMKRRATAEAARREADRALQAWAANEFGVESKEAIDFGFPPPRKPELTVEAKALAVARRKATREARGTMGRQKEGTRGTLAAPLAPLPAGAVTGEEDVATAPPATAG
jgi:hypothetical protein